MKHQTKLYLVHCGFYDPAVGDGVYESHINLFVAARDFEDARKQVRLEPVFHSRRMHVDGLQEIAFVQGHEVQLREEASKAGQSVITSNRHRDL